MIGGGFGKLGIVGRPKPKINSDGNDVLLEDVQNLLFDRHEIWIPGVEEELYAEIRNDPELMYQMPPRKFEELIASIFRNQGFYVELTPESRDGGYDVLAVQKDSITGDRNYLVECKRYKAQNKVGVGIVRSLLGVVVDQKATKGIVATTSFFTKDAVSFEERNTTLLQLSDYDNLLMWLANLAILK